jgi:endoglucanase
MTACGSRSTVTTPESPNPAIIEPVSEQPLELPNTVAYNLPDEISPQIAVQEMKIGINLGNTLDAPHEGDWALPAKQSYLKAFKEAGFKHVRIPITWDEHTQKNAPYQIDEIFLTRVEQVVDWALAQGLYVIINAHHEKWLKEHYSDQSQAQSIKNRISAIWMQIAARFKTKSAKLMFEMLNEPQGMTIDDVNQLNQRLLSIIRNENPNRLVIFSGNGFTPIDSLLAVNIPDITDKFLIGNFHNYDPWSFAGQCVAQWGSAEDKAQLREIFQQAADWSQINNIPVMMNEFGVAKYDFEHPENVCVLEQRLDYLQTDVALAAEYGIAATFWDDGGSFSTFDRSTETWGPEKEVLISHQ